MVLGEYNENRCTNNPLTLTSKRRIIMNTNTLDYTISATAITPVRTPMQRIKFTAVAGSAEQKGTATLWTGRQASEKFPRKDILLSREIIPANEADIAMLDKSKLAMLLTDATEKYIRTNKTGKLGIGSSVEVSFDYEVMLNMLVAPSERSKKLVTVASIRALLNDALFKTAVAVVIAPEKVENFNRLSREFFPLVCAQDAAISDARAKARDILVLRCAQISLVLPESCEQKLLFDAIVDILGSLEVSTDCDSI